MNEYEPKLITEKRYQNILDELIKLEIFIHWPSLGSPKDEIEKLLDEKFWEIGASGKRYKRDIVLKVLLERSRTENKEIWNSINHHCAEIAEDIFLLTYTISQGERKTERSSIWRKTNNGFKLLFHQGTVIS